MKKSKKSRLSKAKPEKNVAEESILTLVVLGATNKQSKTPLNVAPPTYEDGRFVQKYTRGTRRISRLPQGPRDCRHNRLGSNSHRHQSVTSRTYLTNIKDKDTNSIALNRHDQHRSPRIQGGKSTL